MGYKVYKHTNLMNNKVYIGITKQEPKKRWQNSHGYVGTYMGKAINKYGWNSFKHEILFDNLTEEEACELEQELIAKYKSNIREFGYNIAEGGQVVAGNRERFGVGKHPNHHKRKIALLSADGKIIEVFDSIKSACIKYPECKSSGISKCCLGLLKSYQGRRWSYA